MNCGTRNPVTARNLVAAILCLGWASSGFAAGVECPPGLAAAAAAYGATLGLEQGAIRDSSLGSPLGVEETVQFNLADHACHRGPGQAYREFGAPVCLPPAGQSNRSVRYPFQLYFRKALTLEALYQASWEPGSDGALQVEFEAEGKGWIPVARREVLPQLEGNRGAKDPKGAP